MCVTYIYICICVAHIYMCQLQGSCKIKKTNIKIYERIVNKKNK